MYVSDEISTELQEAPLKEIIDKVLEQARWYDPYFIDRWDGGLHALASVLDFDTESGRPEINFDRSDRIWNVDQELWDFEVECRKHLADNPHITDADSSAEELRDTLWENLEANPIDAITDSIRSSHETLLVHIPCYHGDNDTVGPDRAELKTPHWVKFRAMAHRLGLFPREQIDELLGELHANASYGGVPGITVKLNGREVAEWLKGKSLQQIVLAKPADEHPWIAIFDFFNGSGDFVTFPINWKGLRIPYNKDCVICNHHVDSVFAVTGVSDCDLYDPRSGESKRYNLWFTPRPKKKTTETTQPNQ